MSAGMTDTTPTTPGRIRRGHSYPTPPRVNPWGPPVAPPPWAPPWAPTVPVGPPFAPAPPYPPVARAGASARTWALLAGTAALVVALVALIAVIATAGGSKTAAGPTAHRPSTSEVASPSATTTQPAGPPVQAEELPALLLDAGAINAIMGAHELTVNPSLTTTRLYIDTTDKPECGGVWANANKGVYAGSGWISVQTQYLREPADPRHEVFQSVVSFPTATAATEFVAREAKNWPLCNGRSITTTTPNNPPQSWWVATVSRQDTLLTSVINREGGHGWGCQHALTSRNNVVVDVETCGFAVGQQAAEIAGKVARAIH